MGKKQDDDDMSFLEEGEKSPIGMIIGGVVLLVVIIILCVVIWKLSHKDEGGSQPPDRGQAAVGTMEESRESSQQSQAASESGGGTTQPSGQEGGGETTRPSGQQSGGESSPPSGQGGIAPDDENAALSMTFRDVDETVTPKEATNLRSVPSTASDDTIVVKLKNGEKVTRTGLNADTGWSRLEYNGQTVYALSRLLTTDLKAPADSEGSSGSTVKSEENKPSQPPVTNVSGTDSNTVTTKDGTTVTFTPCDDVVSPKMEVNLRGEPSTSQGNASVHARLKYGETVKRTGYQATTDDSGWSRVEYNGEVLYAVTSYLFVVEETDGEGE